MIGRVYRRLPILIGVAGIAVVGVLFFASGSDKKLPLLLATVGLVGGLGLLHYASYSRRDDERAMRADSEQTGQPKRYGVTLFAAVIWLIVGLYSIVQLGDQYSGQLLKLLRPVGKPGEPPPLGADLYLAMGGVVIAVITGLYLMVLNRAVDEANRVVERMNALEKDVHRYQKKADGLVHQFILSQGTLLPEFLQPIYTELQLLENPNDGFEELQKITLIGEAIALTASGEIDEIMNRFAEMNRGDLREILNRSGDHGQPGDSTHKYFQALAGLAAYEMMRRFPDPKPQSVLKVLTTLSDYQQGDAWRFTP